MEKVGFESRVKNRWAVEVMMSMNLNDGNEPVIDDAYICRISIESDKCEKFTCSKLA